MISVIVATYNRRKGLRTMLDAFAALEAPAHRAWELLVVDNNSSDGTLEALQEAAEGGRLPLRPLFEGRQGKSHALNTAIRAAGGDVLALTDDDAIPERSWLRAIERAVAAHPRHLAFAGRAPAVGASGPLPRGFGIVNYDPGDRPFEIAPFTKPPPGVNTFFRRAAFERYGLFREDLGPGSAVQRAEDTEFTRRLWLAGEPILYCPEVRVYHPVEASRLRRRYSLRWMFWVGRSNARMTGRPRGPAIGGIPRFLFAAIALAALRTLARPRALVDLHALEPAQRLAYQIGLAWEFRRLSRDFDPDRLIPYLDGPPPAPRRPAPATEPAPVPLRPAVWP
jgi:glycosyltransferase involved in cell wall biosynthesis